MTENWQFFLQKEGDYAWLPLETPQVEILEGRYQLIAHTAESRSSVRVTIHHQYQQDNIDQENIQETVRQVELSGKIEILPLAYLGLGAWSISCYPQTHDGTEEATETLDQTPYCLELQVLPQDFDLFEDWSYEDLEPAEDTASDPDFIAATLESADHLNQRITVCSDQELNAPQQGEISASEQAESYEEAPRLSSAEIFLPVFTSNTPTVEFRTVQPRGLPQLISDRAILNSSVTPELPPFSRSQLAAQRKQARRLKALTKIQWIGAAVSQHYSLEPRILPVSLERFKLKLSQLADLTG